MIVPRGIKLISLVGRGMGWGNKGNKELARVFIFSKAVGHRSLLLRRSPDNIKERASFPTGEPGRTLPAVRNWLELQKPFVSLGVASFGPIDPKEGSPTYGSICFCCSILLSFSSSTWEVNSY